MPTGPRLIHAPPSRSSPASASAAHRVEAVDEVARDDSVEAAARLQRRPRREREEVAHRERERRARRRAARRRERRDARHGDRVRLRLEAHGVVPAVVVRARARLQRARRADAVEEDLGDRPEHGRVLVRLDVAARLARDLPREPAQPRARHEHRRARLVRRGRGAHGSRRRRALRSSRSRASQPRSARRIGASSSACTPSALQSRTKGESTLPASSSSRRRDVDGRRAARPEQRRGGGRGRAASAAAARPAAASSAARSSAPRRATPRSARFVARAGPPGAGRRAAEHGELARRRAHALGPLPAVDGRAARAARRRRQVARAAASPSRPGRARSSSRRRPSAARGACSASPRGRPAARAPRRAAAAGEQKPPGAGRGDAHSASRKQDLNLPPWIRWWRPPRALHADREEASRSAARPTKRSAGRGDRCLHRRDQQRRNGR